MPAFQISLSALKHNATILRDVANQAECHIVLALKGFSTWGAFAPLKEQLDGCCASGLWEAQLAKKHWNKHILTYSPAYSSEELTQLLNISTHLDFNSVNQWKTFQSEVLHHPRFLSGELKCGLRINPQCSTGHTPLYDPCIPGSRLGIIRDHLAHVDLTGISGFHFHTLCEQGSDDLEKTLEAVEEKFGDLLARPEITWLNMGGGHWITQPDYDRQRLINLIKRVKKTYNLDIWLEPGEACAIHTGVLRCKVLDAFDSCGFHLAILDVSASAHMPDVLEMPYRPDVFRVLKNTANFTHDTFHSTSCEKKSPALCLPHENYELAGEKDEKALTYRLGASTCLAGDILGDYSFNEPLNIGDELIFDDMSHYTMVKTTYFNGVRHPDIELVHEDGTIQTLRQFTYEDFESRLG